MTALVSRHVGARDFKQAGFYIRQGLLLACFISVALSVVGFVATPPVLRFMGAGETTLVMAIPYLRVFFVSTILFGLSETMYAVFRASGDTRTPTLVGVSAVVLNMILDPVLIFGFGPIPELGVPGASIATGISVLFAVVLIGFKLLRGKLGYRVKGVFHARPHLPSMVKIIRIGLPIGSHNLVFVLVYWFLIKFVHEFGEAAGAAMGIGNRMESLSYLTCYGFSVAAATMVGQNLGAGNPRRAAQCAWGAMGVGIGLTMIITVLFLSIPRSIAGIFTTDPEVLAIATDYLIILGLSQSTMAIEIILEGAFSGAGDTVPPMMVSIPGAVARIPLAYYLAFTLGWGINGIWWTLTITTVVKAVVLAGWFRRGKWRFKKV